MQEQIRRTRVSKETRFSSRPSVKKAFTLHAVFVCSSLLAQHDVKKEINMRHTTWYAFKCHTECYLRNKSVMFKHHVIAISREERAGKGVWYVDSYRITLCRKLGEHNQSAGGLITRTASPIHPPSSHSHSDSLCYSSLFSLCTHKYTRSECSHETPCFFKRG